MLTVVVNNTDKKDELDFKARVKEIMIRQIKKKFFSSNDKKLRRTEGVEYAGTKGVV